MEVESEMIYYSEDGSLSVELDFCRYDEGYRIRIMSDVDYKNRDASPAATHRTPDQPHDFILWDGSIETLEQAKAVASLWTDATDLYIKGIADFDTISQTLAAYLQGIGDGYIRQLPSQNRSPPAEIKVEKPFTPPKPLVRSPPTVPPPLKFEVLRDDLKKSVIGQDAAVEAIAYQTAQFLKKRHSKRPMSIVLYGPPASGKSECAKTLAEILANQRDSPFHTVWTDLNQFTEPHSVERLIGAPPSYVGYGDPPVFSEVMKHKRTVFIFDELEKAHPTVLKLFMGILDEGRCQANQKLDDGSRTYDFSQAILLFTTNAKLGGKGGEKKIGFSVAEDVEEIICGDGGVDVAYRPDSVSAEDQLSLPQRIYSETEKARKAFVKLGTLPEIASRFGSFIPFGPITPAARERILAKLVVEAGFEYGLKITHIGSDILRELMDVVNAEESLTVRSYRETISGYLADCFADAADSAEDIFVQLGGTLALPLLTPAESS